MKLDLGSYVILCHKIFNFILPLPFMFIFIFSPSLSSHSVSPSKYLVDVTTIRASNVARVDISQPHPLKHPPQPVWIPVHRRHPRLQPIPHQSTSTHPPETRVDIRAPPPSTLPPQTLPVKPRAEWTHKGGGGVVQSPAVSSQREAALPYH